MSVKDIIFVVLAACLMCYLHRRDMLGRRWPNWERWFPCWLYGWF